MNIKITGTNHENMIPPSSSTASKIHTSIKYAGISFFFEEESVNY